MDEYHRQLYRSLQGGGNARKLALGARGQRGAAGGKKKKQSRIVQPASSAAFSSLPGSASGARSRLAGAGSPLDPVAAGRRAALVSKAAVCCPPRPEPAPSFLSSLHFVCGLPLSRLPLHSLPTLERVR